ncbi:MULTISPECIES: hypothetical protein [unclassified Clostridium]|uniref:hypothetical protein n=1 Tax=unclassified Clostridium TaxID=2614128 RepID=UPI0025C46160|nr:MULTISPECIES: hypothetical protein [unclassified Clostridium]
MKRKIYSFIVILYTIFTICIFKFYATDKRDEEIVSNIFNRDNIMINNDQIFSIHEKNELHKEKDLEKEEKLEKNIQIDNNKSKFNDRNLDTKLFLDEVDENTEVIVEGEFDSYNIEQRKKNSVIKIPPEEIETALSINDKVKLFTISDKIPKEEQNKINDYLQYKNQKIGVRKSLDVLENYLSEKELYEVKKIARKFIDMDTVENAD